ncbi:MAG: PKD domain-containing protein [Thermoanaerobaculia bacterium]|nr:MAG: PKD domain-containing protein [Thermoanaerobaculia bacterium]
MSAVGNRPDQVLPAASRLRAARLALALAGLAAASGAAEIISFPIELQADRRGRETLEWTFAAALPDRPLREDLQGYQPAVAGAPILWEGPAELRWDFGDGCSPVSTGERASASHVYEQNGNYVVTVTARDRRGVFATGTLEIEVTNRPPHSRHVAAVEIDPATSTVELTATSQDAEKDELQFAWEFGDGQAAAGPAEDLWRVRHRYPGPGTWEAKLTITDSDGAEEVETKKVRVIGGDPGTESEKVEIGDEAPPEEIVTGLAGSVSGAVAADLDARVRPLRGLYLQRVASGACRFMFTAWDDASLTSLIAVVDLFGVPPEGARFRIERPQVTLLFSPDARHYDYQRRVNSGRLVDGLGAFIEEVGRRTPVPGGEPPDVPPLDPNPIPDAETDTRLPAVSPLGVEDRTSFMTRSGTLDLEFLPGERAIGHFDLVLEAKHGHARGQTVDFDFDLLLDLAEARDQGIVNYEGCEPPPFEIESTWPRAGTEHLTLERPRIQVAFSDRIDPETFDEATFQVTYPRIGGELVPVGGRILRDDERVTFVPDEPLLPGVWHTVRVAAGETGVRSRGGEPLEDTEGSGWRTSKFATRVDTIPETDGDQLLACHLFQTARDAPLVPGKPAVARVWAMWERQIGVDEAAHVEELTARVVIKDALHNELAAAWHTFVRPDRWGERRIQLRAAEHTAQIFGLVPRAGLAGPLRVELEVRDEPGSETLRIAHVGRCPTTVWDHSPRLSIDFVALPFGEWEDSDALTAVGPALNRIAAAAANHSWQLFPVVDVEHGPVRTLPFPPGYRLPPVADCPSGCLMNGAGEGHWWQGFDAWLRGQSSADIVVAFGPHGVQEGGSSGGHVRQAGRGAALFLVSDNPELFSRYVQGVVHEVAHTLDLEHLPFIADGPGANARRDELLALREGSKPIVYRGIEGLLISRDGRSARNKSSVEGNEDDTWLPPLMFPGGFPTHRSFIANHHYRALQRLFEDLGK